MVLASKVRKATSEQGLLRNVEQKLKLVAGYLQGSSQPSFALIKPIVLGWRRGSESNALIQSTRIPTSGWRFLISA
jgi:hypothetical protein